MITTNVALVPVRAIAQAWAALAGQESREDSGQLKVFLDCDAWFEDCMRSEVDFVTYVSDRRRADVCVRVTPVAGQGKTRAYRVRFIGAGRFKFIEASARIRFTNDRMKRSLRLGPEESNRRSRRATHRRVEDAATIS